MTKLCFAIYNWTCLFQATKAHIKLNTKKLYQSDGYAVKELLKVTSMLYSAMRTNKQDANEESGDAPLSFDISSRVSEIYTTISSMNFETISRRPWSHDLVVWKRISGKDNTKKSKTRLACHIAIFTWIPWKLVIPLHFISWKLIFWY